MSGSDARRLLVVILALAGVVVAFMGLMVWWASSRPPLKVAPLPIAEVRRAIGPAGPLTYERAKTLGFGETQYSTARFAMIGPRGCTEAYFTFEPGSGSAKSAACRGNLTREELRAVFDALNRELGLNQPVHTDSRGSYATQLTSEPPLQLTGTITRAGLLGERPDPSSHLTVSRHCPRATDAAACDALFTEAVDRLFAAALRVQP
jgi:hypothetical protein